MSYRSLILMIVLGFTSAPTFAQRVFATIDPNAGLEEALYKFDTNSVPVGAESPSTPSLNDINFPPNIVFTPDSTRGFVSYPGSDKVLVFSPQTGEILAALATGTNPAMLSLTPDGKKLAVPCLFLKDNAPQKDNLKGKQIGAVNIIDVVSLEVKTIDFTKVQFSVANNIVFSSDGKTGYIASAGTDDLIRFDVETATEITPRLKLSPETLYGLAGSESGMTPSSLTMAADGSFMTVVLIGSGFLDRRQYPETIVIVETETFSVRTKVNTAVKANEIAFNFLPANTVALTADGKLGLIGEQALSSLLNSPYNTDRALLFDTSTGEIVKLYDVGYKPGSAHTMPDGKRFAMLGEIWVMMFNSEDKALGQLTPIYASDYKPANRPGFSPDGKLMFITNPLDDNLITISLDTGETRRIIEVGRQIQPEPDEDDPMRFYTAAPMAPVMTPDGQVLASLNFNTNTIDLLKSTYSFSVPTFYHTDQWFTGVALTNHSAAREATLNLNAYSWAGIEYQDLEDTEDEIDYTNPNTIKLAPGRQTAFTAAGLIKPTGANKVDGWLDIDSDVSEIASFYLVGDAAIKRLDGAPVFLQLARTVVLPEVRVTDSFKTEVAIFNYTWTDNPATMTLYNEEGESLSTVEVASPGIRGGMQQVGFLRDPDGTEALTGIFEDAAFEDFTNGYIVIRAQFPILAVERYYDGERMSMLQGTPKDTGQAVDKVFFIPQVAAFAGSDTLLNLINTGSETIQVAAVLKDNSGQSVGAPADLVIEPGKIVRKSIVELFGLTDGGLTVSGWIRLEADKAGLMGDAEVRTFEGKAMTTVPLTSSGGRNLSFSHVAEGMGYSTGISLLNPGGETATAQIEVYSQEGARIAGRQVTIPAGGRLVNLLTDPQMFPQLEDTIGGYVKVSSNQNLVGLEMFYTENLEILSLVSAQILQ